MKTCTRCKVSQELSSFPKSGGKGGLSYRCRRCLSESRQEKRDQNNEQLFVKTGTKTIDTWLDVLKCAKQALGLTTADIARQIGISQTNVRLWFVDGSARKYPRQRNLRKLFEVLSVDLPLELTPDISFKLPITVLACAACGKPFPVYKNGVKHCSRECSGHSFSQRQRGSANAMWKGGEIVTRPLNGYIKQLAPGHAAADASGYVMQHRLVMAATLGRPLESFERVHHKNGDRKDNRPENLELWLTTAKSKKDPAGQRMKDLMTAFLNQPEIVDRGAVAVAFQRIFRL